MVWFWSPALVQSHTHTPQLPTHTQMLTPMSEGCMFFFFFCYWQEPSLAQHSPVDRRRGRDLKRSAQTDCLQRWLAAW